MPVTNIYTVNGAIIGESTGGVRTPYLTDALGNFAASYLCYKLPNFRPNYGPLAL